MCRAIFPLYRLVQPSNGGLRCCYCQHSGHCIGIGAVAYRLHWRELRLTRILLAVHLSSLPSSFAFRRRLHRFRIFCFRSDRPITFIFLPPTIVSVSSSLAWLGYCPLSHTYTRIRRVIKPSARCGQSGISIDWISCLGPSSIIRFEPLPASSNDLFLLPGPGAALFIPIWI